MHTQQPWPSSICSPTPRRCPHNGLGAHSLGFAICSMRRLVTVIFPSIPYDILRIHLVIVENDEFSESTPDLLAIA